ncbi:MAG: 4'-phosphopantetheinyl transferase superfamily protein [Lachnospiraceae bacterium]|nr:4'-phosphopantetheinyl transferase superfamily protein [Lachnospiraceae bacterium]
MKESGITQKVYIYVCETELYGQYDSVPDYCKKEIETVTNKKVVMQKRCAYGLLRRAAEEVYGCTPDFGTFYKNQAGKPLCHKFHFSISHHDDVVAVCISEKNVGIDIEERSDKMDDKFFDRILSYEEKCKKESVENDPLKLWTIKEAYHKFIGVLPIYNPVKLNTTEVNYSSFDLEYRGKEFMISVVSEEIPNIKYINLLLT